MATADIGLIGLAVMGQNLVLNMNDHGFKVAVFNRTLSKVDEFLATAAKGTNVLGTKSLEEFVCALKKPRIIMLLVKAGDAVDEFIAKLLPLLEQGDIIVDGGNSEFLDTERRCNELAKKDILYVGSGVSGGEEGARYGPSLMPGGNPKAWPRIQPIFQAIAAKAKSGEPCCGWTGSGGAGHFVKMVHNGIEYGDMQLIAEAYHLMREIARFSNEEMALKGTGKWTAICGLERGTPITLIAEAVFSRVLSSLRDTRLEAAKALPAPSHVGTKPLTPAEKKEFAEKIRQALYASKVISYTQGFMLLNRSHVDFGWQLDLGAVALMWRGGCIIRSKFLDNIKEAFDRNPRLNNLLLDPFFNNAIKGCQDGWRHIVSQAALNGIPAPAFSSALAFYDGLRCCSLPANLIQAQRDYFGAHQFERIENPGTFVHADWTGHGGSVASSTYQA
ncbi:6-phosphogluconate dehydrogenase [Paragonimus westermani]|uniref:6-phosphogluconate dehydrogenase, decarboxylating n=1 Tax=Paragonimus westermani TaxID=34504 RepID=A0A5J4P2F4_9TREM|nr:6-phosphogluconate dehydrogenase [Paragonimus westermani]